MPTSAVRRAAVDCIFLSGRVFGWLERILEDSGLNLSDVLARTVPRMFASGMLPARQPRPAAALARRRRIGAQQKTRQIVDALTFIVPPARWSAEASSRGPPSSMGPARPGLGERA
jgi:hypothetical protein